MPNEHHAPSELAKVEQLGKQATSNMLDALIRVFSLQQALVENGSLTQAQIDKHFDALNSLESVQSVRKQYGSAEPTLGAILDSLLRNYQGPLQ